MLPKIAHVIIIGLPEEKRGKLDKSTRKILHFSDPSWEYTSYGCSTLEEAATMAKTWQESIYSISRGNGPSPLQAKSLVSNLITRL